MRKDHVAKHVSGNTSSENPVRDLENDPPIHDRSVWKSEHMLPASPLPFLSLFIYLFS